MNNFKRKEIAKEIANLEKIAIRTAIKTAAKTQIEKVTADKLLEAGPNGPAYFFIKILLTKLILRV